MRLKFLFFPIVLVISLSIFIGYAWPEIQNIRDVNVKIASNTALLNAEKEKKTAIESLGSKVRENGEIDVAIKTYLPENKVEERIINGVDYLAADANVSLVDIKLASKLSDAPVAPQLVDPNSANGAKMAAVFNPVTGLPETVSVDLLSNTQATMEVNGSYDNIRIFVNQIQHMQLFNTVQSLKIGTVADDSSDANASDGNPKLSVKLVVDFGYLSASKLDDAKVSKFNAELDNDTLKILNDYTSKKTPTLSVDDTNNKGKSNPFLP